MAQVTIGTMDTTIEFEPEAITAQAPAGAGMAGAPATPADVLRLRELLRPVIVELLQDELARYRRIRG